MENNDFDGLDDLAAFDAPATASEPSNGSKPEESTADLSGLDDLDAFVGEASCATDASAGDDSSFSIPDEILREAALEEGSTESFAAPVVKKPVDPSKVCEVCDNEATEKVKSHGAWLKLCKDCAAREKESLAIEGEPVETAKMNGASAEEKLWGLDIKQDREAALKTNPVNEEAAEFKDDENEAYLAGRETINALSDIGVVRERIELLEKEAVRKRRQVAGLLRAIDEAYTVATSEHRKKLLDSDKSYEEKRKARKSGKSEESAKRSASGVKKPKGQKVYDDLIRAGLPDAVAIGEVIKNYGNDVAASIIRSMR